MANINTIKNWFRTGKKPTQQQFWDTWDSFRHKDEKVPAGDIKGIDELLLQKADRAVLDDHLVNANAHAELFALKVDKSQKGVAGGYAPLNDVVKIAGQYLDIVNDLTTGGVASLLSAEQGKIIKSQIDTINILLASDDVNLDTVQELVVAIKALQTSLNTILVNDLVTGGVTKALTAEQGKVLKGLIDAAKVVDESNLLHKIGDEIKTGTLTAAKFITAGGGADQYVKGDGSLSTLTLPVSGDITGKEDKTNKGVANGYAPLNDVVKIAGQYLDIVNDLTTGGVAALLSAEQGKILKSQIDAVNILLTSDDVNLDTVQELVNAIKVVQTSLNTILVNDLTTGGITKALTAEQGKVLKGLIDAVKVVDESNLLHKTGDEVKTGTLTATKFITAGGSADQYVKGDGTLGTPASGVGTLQEVTDKGNSTNHELLIQGMELGCDSHKNVYFGHIKKDTTGDNNIALGRNSLSNNATGRYNTSLGTNTLNNNTTGDYNTAIGAGSLNGNTTGSNNTALGIASLNGNKTGNHNVGIGESANPKNPTNKDGNLAIHSSNADYLEEPLVAGNFIDRWFKIAGKIFLDIVRTPNSTGDAAFTKVLTAQEDGTIGWEDRATIVATPVDITGKEDKTNKGVANGYAPLNDVVKIAGQYLDIVNNLTTGGVAALLSAEQGKILKSQIDAVNILLTSDDVNLDTVQELVAAIKGLQTSLNTILVNDLTTGGVTKALTAEQGKVLKGLIDAVKVVDESNLLHKTGNEVKTGTLTATKFITAGGSADQYVKGDGSLGTPEKYIPTLQEVTDKDNSTNNELIIRDTKLGRDKYRNLYFGYLNSNITGGDNSVFGNVSFYKNTTGSNNTSLGSGTLSDNTTGSFNTAVGAGSLNGNTTGSNNTALGIDSLNGNKTGNHNIGIGNRANPKNPKNSNGNLAIHSSDAGIPEEPLISGNFIDRWFKIAGKIFLDIVKTPNSKGDASFTKVLTAKEDGTIGWEDKVTAGGATPAVTVINNLITGGTDKALSAEQGKVLKDSVDSINNKLVSDDPNFDTLQEVVNELKKAKPTIDESNLLHKTGDEVKNGYLEVINDNYYTYALVGRSKNSTAVAGYSNRCTGVYGSSKKEFGVRGDSDLGFGVFGYSSSETGLYGKSDTGTGMTAQSYKGKIASFNKGDDIINSIEVASIDNDGNFISPKHITQGGTDKQYVKGDGTLGDISALTSTPAVDITGKEDKANKGVANGYAPLDANGKLPASNIPANVVTKNGTADQYIKGDGSLDTITFPAPVDISGKEDKANKGKASGYAPLDANSKVPTAYLPDTPNVTVINDLITGGTDKALSAEQGKVLKDSVDSINTKLVSDNTDFDTLQKIVDRLTNKTKGDVRGVSTSGAGWGVGGKSDKGAGVKGDSNSGNGVEGISSDGYGVFGITTHGTDKNPAKAAVHGQSNTGPGVEGFSAVSPAVIAIAVSNNEALRTISYSGKSASFNKGSYTDFIEVASVENDGTMISPKFKTTGGTDKQFIKGDGTLGDISSLTSTPAIIPIATTSKEGLLSASDKAKLDNVPAAFNAALLGNVLAYWDGRNDPTINNQAYPMAKMFGDAAFIDSAAGVRLTPALNSKSGSLFWDFNQQNAMYIKFKFKASGGTPKGADATYFYCYADGVPLQETGGGDFTKGYIVYFSEYQKAIGVIYGPDNIGELLVSGNGEAGKPLIAVTQEGITSADFHLVEIYIILNRILVYYDGVKLIDYYDKYDRDISGTKFGFGARTGGLNNNHDIKGLVVQKYSSGIGGRLIDEIA